MFRSIERKGRSFMLYLWDWMSSMIKFVWNSGGCFMNVDLMGTIVYRAKKGHV